MSSYVLGSFVRRVACAALGFAALLVAAPARAEVVFGNLGATGETALGTNNTLLGTSSTSASNWAAQGFNTGASTRLDVQSVTLGLSWLPSDTENRPVTVSLFLDNGSGAPGSVFATSGTQLVSLKDKYTFDFSNVTLAADTTYWIVPNGGAWFYNAQLAPAAPTEQNSSGYSYVGPFAKESSAAGSSPAGPWYSGESARYSVSLTAVPEPSTLALASIGVAMVVGLEVRRRRRRVELIQV